jgi:hypothetical protein
MNIPLSQRTRTISLAALSAVGLLVVVRTHQHPSKRRAVYWGITNQLDEMNGAIDSARSVGEDLK